jgi:hypothetical protein
MESEQLQQKAREFQARLAPQIDDAKRNLSELNAKIISFIRARPGTCLLGALAFGYIVGRIASKNR